MKAEKNEILFFYNSEKQEDRKAFGYAESIDSHKLNERNIIKDNLTETHIAEIADDMHVTVAELIDKNSEYYMNELKGKDYSSAELLDILERHPEAIKTPIAYVGKKAFFVESAYSFVKQDIEVKGVTSEAGNAFEKPVEERNL